MFRYSTYFCVIDQGWGTSEFPIREGEKSPLKTDDDIWEDVLNKFFGGTTRQVNSGSYPACSILYKELIFQDYQTRQCFESVGDYFTRSLRKIIWTTVIDIDLDDNPRNIPYFTLYAASMVIYTLGKW